MLVDLADWHPLTKKPDGPWPVLFLIPTPDGQWWENATPLRAFEVLREPSAEDLSDPNPCRSVSWRELVPCSAIAWRYA